MEGMFGVQFQAHPGTAGSGVAILEGGKLRGGDYGYYYTGSYAVADGILKARVRVRHFNGELTSIFGPLTDFEVEISGQVNGTQVNGTGRMVGSPGAMLGVRIWRLPD